MPFLEYKREIMNKKLIKLLGFLFCQMSFAEKRKDIIEYTIIKGLPSIKVIRESQNIGQTWLRNCDDVHDKPLLQKFYSLLNSHDGFFVVLDIGAQTGLFSLMAKYFPHSKWYAFEPIKEAIHTLKKNLAVNNINNVFMHEVAVSDICGKSTLKMPDKNNWGLSTLGSTPLRFSKTGEREVNCITLDAFVDTQQIKRVHFIKIDTEGWELYILRGAQQLLMRDHPIILMEYNETNMKQCGVVKQDINNFLRTMGYQWLSISDDDILCIPNYL